MARSIHPVVVGTAGHIDHGKSSLVRALTGIDPDRLKEEKERGLTIDLGFARLRMSDGRWLGLVDVPGHERFIRNMVAGCSGIDLVLLVVAADDGVMPQTREHLDIIQLLGVRAGLVALTKVDLVDETLCALAEEDIASAVAGTVLENAPVLRVSSVTGQGVAELKEALESLALSVEPRMSGGAFRMPIQRVFSLPGIGTVLTGIPQSGSIRVGDEIEIHPIGERARIRAVHAYGGKVDEAVAGHSTALSVPDAKEAGVHRGMVVCAPSAFTDGDAVDVSLRLIGRSPALAHRQPIRFHTGTAEVRGELLLLDRDALRPGEEANARVELDELLCCARGDRFLLRLQNPLLTVSGGVVLRLGRAGRYRRRALAAELRGIVEAGDRPEARIEHELSIAGPEGRPLSAIASTLGIDEGRVAGLADSMPAVHLHAKGKRLFLTATMDAGEAELLASVRRILEKKPLAASLPRTAIRTTRTLPRELFDAVLDRMQDQGRVRGGTHGRVLFLERLRPLEPEDRAMLDRLVRALEEAGSRPPTRIELMASLGLDETALQNLIARGEDEGLVEVVGEHVYAASFVRQMLRAVRANCLAHDGVLDIPELRDRLGTSRKYLIPLLEHVDALGLTVLRGGLRRLLPGSECNRILEQEERSPPSSRP